MAFEGRGWQGQHLLVFPSKRLVVVRMRDVQRIGGGAPETDKRFGFWDMAGYVEKLVPAKN